MNVGIYIQDYNPKAGGASTLLATIQKEIINANDINNTFFFLYNGDINTPYKTLNDNFFYLNISYFKKLSFLQRLKRKVKTVLGKKYTYLNSFDEITRLENIDIYWLTFPTSADISIPYIYTVWDLGHRTTPYFPEVSRTGWLWNSREEMYQRMFYKASYIITGNEEGKKEILTNYPMPSNKIRINPFPVASFCRGAEIKPKFDFPEKFFFYPAQFWPHKNHICILKALKLLNEKNDIQPIIFLTGSDKGNKEYIQQKIIEYKLEKQVFFTGFLSDEEIKYLYTHATAMIFASLMGPNNMPPIEATYLNCPVIISDLEGHKEQLKDTALYFNGYKPEELAEHMKNLLGSNSIREELKSAEKTLAIEFESVNYFSGIKKILNEFSLIRDTWGKHYVHL